jgi:hypothetical protein
MKRSNDITGVLLLCSQLYRQSLIVMNMGSKQTCDADPCCISQKEGDHHLPVNHPYIATPGAHDRPKGLQTTDCMHQCLTASSTCVTATAFVEINTAHANLL